MELIRFYHDLLADHFQNDPHNALAKTDIENDPTLPALVVTGFRPGDHLSPDVKNATASTFDYVARVFSCYSESFIHFRLARDSRALSSVWQGWLCSEGVCRLDNLRFIIYDQQFQEVSDPP